MRYDPFDDSVSLTMNVLLVIGNILVLAFNTLQTLRTYRIKSAKDFGGTVLILKDINNGIWFAYAVQTGHFLSLLSSIASLLGSLFISYYKYIELYGEPKKLEKIKNENLELKNSSAPPPERKKNNALDRNETKI